MAFQKSEAAFLQAYLQYLPRHKPRLYDSMVSSEVRKRFEVRWRILDMRFIKLISLIVALYSTQKTWYPFAYIDSSYRFQLYLNTNEIETFAWSYDFFNFQKMEDLWYKKHATSIFLKKLDSSDYGNVLIPFSQNLVTRCGVQLYFLLPVDSRRSTSMS